MGIKGLSKFLKTYIPSAIQKISLETLRGKWVAIDANYYYVKYSINTQDVMYKFEKQITHLTNLGIHILYVFDGRAPEEKKETIEKRREALDRKHIKVKFSGISSFKSYLRNKDIPYIECETESDFVCSNLCRFGLIEGCITDDMDFLPLGTKRLLRDYSPFTNDITLYSLDEIVKRIPMEIFIEICIYLGCDYCFKPQEYIYRCNDLDIMNMFMEHKTVNAVWKFLYQEKKQVFYEKLEKEPHYFLNVDFHIDKARRILENNPMKCKFDVYKQRYMELEDRNNCKYL